MNAMPNASPEGTAQRRLIVLSLAQAALVMTATGLFLVDTPGESLLGVVLLVVAAADIGCAARFVRTA